VRRDTGADAGQRRRPCAPRPGKEAVAVHLFREPCKEAGWWRLRLRGLLDCQ
jgi:hypothetical protein